MQFEMTVAKVGMVAVKSAALDDALCTSSAVLSKVHACTPVAKGCWHVPATCSHVMHCVYMHVHVRKELQ